MIDKTTIERVLQSVDIVDVVSGHLTLQKKGSLYWGC